TLGSHGCRSPSPPRPGPHRARALGSARPRAPRRRAHHAVRARGRRPRRARAAVPRLPAGRPGLRGAPPDAAPERPRLAGARAGGLPRAHARPARDITLELWWTYFDSSAASAEERLRSHDDPVLAAADAYSY